MTKVVPKKEEPKTKGPGGKKIRTSDDLELLRIILDDNGPLRDRVLRFIEKSLGKDATKP